MTLSPITYDEMRPGCYDPKARLADMDGQLGRGVAVLPDVPALLRPDLPRGQGPRPRAGVRQGLQRLDGRGVVRRQRRPAHPAQHHPAVGRRGVRRARCAATPRAASAPCASARSRRTSACRAIHTGYWDPFFAGVRGDRHRRVHAHRLVVEDAGRPRPTRRRRCSATLSFNNAMASLTDFLFSGVLVRYPDAQAGLLRGPDRLDPLHPRAGRRRVGRAPGLGRRQGHRPRAAVDLLLPPGLRLLLPRPARAQVARRGRRRQRHVRDRLPAHRLDVARHQGDRRPT